MQADHPKDDAATLRLDFETDAGVDVRDMAEIFEKLEAAFSASQDDIPEGERLSLRLFAVRSGSVIADFIVVAAGGVTLWEFRKAAMEFTASLFRGLKKLLGQEPGEAKREDRELLDRVVQIVSLGDVDRVTIRVIGDNETIIIIDRLVAEDYLARDAERPSELDAPES